MSPEQIINKVNYRANAVFKNAAGDTRSLSRKGHNIYQTFVGDTVKVMRRTEAVKTVGEWIADGFDLVGDVAGDVLP